MKASFKYVIIQAVKNKKVYDLLFVDWVGTCGAIETAKMHGFKPLSSKSGTYSIDVGLEDVCEATIKAEAGAEIIHDLMYDSVATDFTEAYHPKPVDPDGYLKGESTNV